MHGVLGMKVQFLADVMLCLPACLATANTKDSSYGFRALTGHETRILDSDWLGWGHEKQPLVTLIS